MSATEADAVITVTAQVFRLLGLALMRRKYRGQRTEVRGLAADFDKSMILFPDGLWVCLAPAEEC